MLDWLSNVGLGLAWKALLMIVGAMLTVHLPTLLRSQVSRSVALEALTIAEDLVRASHQRFPETDWDERAEDLVELLMQKVSGLNDPESARRILDATAHRLGL